MTEVFVSYKAEDRTRVRPLVKALEAESLAVWWDAQVAGGDDWRDSIAEHLEAAQCVIVVWSKRSTGRDGRFVRDEATRAQRRGVYLPIKIDRVEPPLGFGETQALDLNGWNGDRADPRYQGVLAAVHSVLGRQPPEVAGRARVSRRSLLAASGAALAAAAAGTWMALGPGGAKSDSIAVLPFANLSGDPAQVYFSDGLAEELRGALSVIAGLKVVARTSSEMLRSADAKTAASQLSVANIITGSVRRSPSTIRVSAQLIDGASGLERWSQSFDRPTGDVLEIQTDIAENVAQALSVELGGIERSSFSVGGTRNPEAQDLLLQANQFRRDDSEASMRRALGILDKVIALDPNYAEAHAQRAFLINAWASTYAASVVVMQRAQARALSAARRAITLAPRLASGPASLGHIYRAQLHMGAALRSLRQSDALPGNDVQSLIILSAVLAQMGRQDEALAKAEQAAGLDPLNPFIFETKAVILFQGRSYEQATESARRALQIAPDRTRAKSFLGNSLLMLGRPDEAARVYAGIGDDFRRSVGEAGLAAQRGPRSEAQQMLKVLEQRFGETGNYQYAQIAAQIGDGDLAIVYLNEAWKKRDPGLASIRVDPFLDPLRKDPRLDQIAARLRFS